MNSPKLTNVLLLALVLLLCFHVGLETFRPIGRYVRIGGGSSRAVLDTSQGTMYIAVGPGDGRIINVVRLTKQFNDQKPTQPIQAEPEAPTGEPPDETHRP